MTESAPTAITGAYQLARWVAHQLPHHPGATARELYQHYLPRFAEYGTDGTVGTTMIGQDLKDLEMKGCIVGERSAKKNGPTQWTWTGKIAAGDGATGKHSLPVDAAQAPPATDREIQTVHSATETGEPIAAASQAIIDTAADSRDLPADEYSAPLGDCWDALARSFAQACRDTAIAQHAPVDGLEHKLDVLDRIIPLLSDDLAITLSAIRSDLATLGDPRP